MEPTRKKISIEHKVGQWYEKLEIEALCIDLLGVHPSQDGEGFVVTHLASGCTFGLTAIPTEEEALEAAKSALADEEVYAVLSAESREECLSRAESMGVEAFQERMTEIMNALQVAWYTAAIEQPGEEEPTYTVEDLIRLVQSDDRAAIEGIESDAAVEAIEGATDAVKDRLLRCIVDERHDKVYDWGGEYKEPGYANPDRPMVVLGDWWHRTPATEDKPHGDLIGSVLATLIEAAGGAIEWHDEWTCCSECGGVVRVSADSYSWTRSYVEWEGDLICHECMEDHDHRRDYLEQVIEGDPRMAETIGWDLSELGYVRLDEDFQNGLYGGQSANPGKIAEALRSRDIERFVFQIDSVGQFDARFSCWVHEDEMPEGGLTLDTDETDGPDPAEAMKAALQDASAKMSELDAGDGVKVATCNADGTATVRVVSPEDFIAGKALEGAK